jgi:hypothetical protein
LRSIFLTAWRLQKEERVLKTGSDLFEEWATPDTFTWFAVTLYNVTNVRDVLHKTSKPAVSEVGPYYYRQYKKKEDIKFISKSDVQYKLRDIYLFDENQTGPGLHPDKDRIINLNIPLMAAVNNYTQHLLNESQFHDLLNGKNLSVFNVLTVTELLWGYKDTLTNETFNLYTNNSQLDLTLDSSIDTGVGDINSIGQFVTWRGKSTLQYWNGSYANHLRGTDGTFFHPLLHKDEDVFLFDDCLYRSIKLAVGGQFNVSANVPVYRYGIAESELQNDTVNPKNAMWYSNWFSGLFNLSSPTNNTPMFMSKPHFLDADPHLREEVIGMQKPNRTKDDTLIDAILLTGFVVNFHKRWQINVRLQPVNATFNTTHIRWLHRMQDVLIPIAYSDRFATVSNSTVKEFSHEVTTEEQKTNYLRTGIVAGGGLIAFISAVLLLCWMFCTKKNKDEDSPLLSSSQPDVQIT